MSGARRGIERAIVACAVVAVIAVYWFSWDRDVGFWDTGEMQTVPYILGLAHPNGFPTEIVIGWAFSHLLPLGSPAQRLTLLSVAFTVVSIGVNYSTSRVFGASKSVAAAVAVVVAFTYVVWEHGTRTDVIDAAVFFSALAIRLAVSAARSDRLAMALVCGIVSGAALGTHGVAIFYVAAAACIAIGPSARNRVARIASFAIGTIASASAAYAYLPLRARVVETSHLDPTASLGLPSGTPIWDWGAPSTFERFLDVVAGRSVDAPAAVSNVVGFARYGHDLQFTIAQLQALYSPLVLGVLAAGVIGALAARRLSVGVLFLPLAFVTPFAATFAAESDTARYYIVPIMCLWSVAAVGLTEFAKRGTTAATASAFVLLAMTASEIHGGFALFGRRSDHLGTTYVSDVRASTAANAIIVVPWVYGTPLAYAAYVEHSLDRRLVVFGTMDATMRQRAERWPQGRPVFEIAESESASERRATYMKAFHVNPIAEHDAKLYRWR